MAPTNQTRTHRFLGAFIQFSHPDVIGHRGAIQAHLIGNLLVGQAKLILEPLIGFSPLNGVQIFSLDVLHQCQQQLLTARDLIVNPYRHFIQARKTTGSEPAFSRA